MKVGLLGYGKMGRGIFGLATGAKLPVTIFVRSQEKADKLNQQIDRRLQRALKGGEIDEAGAKQLREEQRFTCNIGDLSDCELIIETISENFEQKIALLEQLNPHLKPDTIVASNTSTFSIAKLAQAIANPERFAGFHLFHPVTLTPMIEILAWDGVDQKIIDTLADVSRLLGKQPLIFRDTPGSAINSILACYYCEGLYILEQGLATPSQIDKIATEFCRIGPCESLDVIGLPFFTESFERMADYRPPQLTTPSLLHRLLKEGRDGKAIGCGVYRYVQDIPTDETTDFYKMADQTHSRIPGQADESVLRDRLLYSICCGVLFNLSRNLGDPADMDWAASEVLAMEHSPFELMRTRGRDNVAADLARLGSDVAFRFDPALLEYLPRECSACR